MGSQSRNLWKMQRPARLVARLNTIRMGTWGRGEDDMTGTTWSWLGRVPGARGLLELF